MLFAKALFTEQKFGPDTTQEGPKTWNERWTSGFLRLQFSRNELEMEDLYYWQVVHNERACGLI